jgi:hypothetical protein
MMKPAGVEDRVAFQAARGARERDDFLLEADRERCDEPAAFAELRDPRCGDRVDADRRDDAVERRRAQIAVDAVGAHRAHVRIAGCVEVAPRRAHQLLVNVDRDDRA